MAASDPQGWRERAEGLRREGRLEEAVHAGRRAVEQAPGDPRAWSELAHALRLGGKLGEAKAAAARAVELGPGLASAWFNLGAVLLAQGDAAQSIEANRKALALDPGLAEAWSNLGGALAASGDSMGEIDAYRRALDINPRLAAVWSNLGNALREARRTAEAVAACRRAVEIDPGFAAAWCNLANAQLESGEPEKALRSSESALRLERGLAEAWSALGGALLALRRYVEAARAHEEAVRLRPGSANLHFNLGMTLRHGGRSADAIAHFRRAIEIEPDHADAHCDLSLALLFTGQLREGWEEFEWRWRRPEAEARRYDFTTWDGDASRPRRLLLWGEQGVGDEVLHGSMLADLVASSVAITLEVDPRLAPLYQRSFPRLAVIPRRAPPAASAATHDCQAPLGSLGRWLRSSFDSFPRRRAFLVPDPSRVDEYRNRLAAGHTTVVGISWRSANREFGSLKSTELGDWLEILKQPRVRFVDLQYGDTASEREMLERRAGLRIEHLAGLDLIGDIDGLAALCTACDLVITISNVTAHLAGAVGCPVWLIAPKGNGRHWYWFSGRGDSPWYPSMRIFDQVTQGNWRPTLDAVARELAAFVKGR
ncbi:MAG: tetratricopeptide repeat protein [Burkholderiales bacterium]